MKSLIKAAYRKINVSSRTQAVLWAVDNGFKPDTLRTVDPALLVRPTHGGDGPPEGRGRPPRGGPGGPHAPSRSCSDSPEGRPPALSDASCHVDERTCATRRGSLLRAISRAHTGASDPRKERVPHRRSTYRLRTSVLPPRRLPALDQTRFHTTPHSRRDPWRERR